MESKQKHEPIDAKRVWLSSAIFILILIVIISAALFWIEKANADYYGVADFGKTRYELIGDGAWFQTEYPYQVNSNPNTFSVGFGNRFSSHFAYEVTYMDLGKMTLFSETVNDESRGCKSNCPPRQMNYIEAQTRGISMTGLWYPRDEFFLRAGGVFVNSEIKVRAHGSGLVAQETPTTTGWNEFHGSNYKLASILGIGIERKNVRVEVQYLKKIGVTHDDQYGAIGIYDKATRVVVGVRF